MKRFQLKSAATAAETYVAIAGTSVAIAVFVVSDTYPEIDRSLGGPPAYYPRILALLLALLSVAVLVEGLARPTRLKVPQRDICVRMVAALAVVSLIPAGIGFAGFLVTGFFVSLALMALLLDWNGGRLRQLAAILLSAAGCTLALFVIFRYLAGVRLPTGTLFD